MKFEVVATEPFDRKLKRLAKKYKSLSRDLIPIIDELEKNPTLGISIGKNCLKSELLLLVQEKVRAEAQE